MLIRSQDKKGITNFNNVKTIRVIQHSCEPNEPYKWGIVHAGLEYLGVYSTEKNAIEVLNMICSAYDDYANRGLEKYWVKSIFQMPEDEDLNFKREEN